MRAVVIGTGAGGLTATAALAKAGVEVVALERAKQLGGFLNPFKRKRYHFDPGVHYVGQAHVGGQLDRVLRRFDIDARELFCEMDPDGFDVLRFPGLEFRVPRGLERYRSNLLETFPEDRKEIERFCEKLAWIKGLFDQRPSGIAAMPLAAAWYFQTFDRLLASSFRNPQVRAVVAAQCGDYGLPPSKTPAILGAGLVLHFIDGAWFPRGGSGSLRDAIVDRAREYGAELRRRAEVTRIEVESGRVKAVHTADGERIEADIVISAIDPSLTYGKLIAPEHLPRSLVRKARDTVPSVASLCIFFGLERDLRNHGLGAFNVWDYPSWDIEEVFGPVVRGDLPDEWAFFLSPNSLKDDTGTMAPQGCSTLEIVTLAPFAPFAKWRDRPALKRGAEYEDFKARVSAQLELAVEARWPGLIGDVAVRDVATPVTNLHFAGGPMGSIYGPMVTPDQFGHRAFRPKGPIQGLFHAGAGVLGPGVVPCLASGVVAAKVALAATGVRRRVALPRLRARLRPSIATG